ncbi:DUF3618 domain-containing protein [Streptomonospora sp. PA3]|uniref:DUF3618 domain-containing protein n=1 Tax=Streptomonospora sp. PA3 TaxID=2607326 RepID=UPI0012DEDDE4|nr:DUF3618 domain-containing protein [Streptomonospora sp. PA3]MUL44223.1 DUF3618 domain-containing protein [Streptomonospora sp. PA3]
MTRETSQQSSVPEQRGGSRAGERSASAGEETERLRLEISRLRTELGDTIEALAAKADLKTRTQQEARRAMDKARSVPGAATRGQRFAAAALLGAVLAGAVGVVVLRRRWSRTHLPAD